MFVLFLTLHVWNGPYLNFWLVSLDYMCVKSRTPATDPNGFTKLIRLCLILLAHLIAVGLAYWLIPVTRDNFKSSMTWPEISTTVNRDANMGYIFVEEVVAVSSLLVGFLYLAWLRSAECSSLRPAPKDGEPSGSDIEFFIRLTLVVTACKRAFPSAHLSPHVSTYLWFSGQIIVDEWATRFGSGVIASALVVLWDKKLRNKTTVEEPTVEVVPLLKDLGDFSAFSNNRPQTPANGGPQANFGRGSSLSISFAKPGIYY